MSIALDYAPVRPAPSRLFGWTGFATLAVTAAVMLEYPARAVAALLTSEWRNRPNVTLGWGNLLGTDFAWNRVAIALLPLLAFTVWNGINRRGAKTSAAVFLGGVSIIGIALICPVPVVWSWSNCTAGW